MPWQVRAKRMQTAGIAVDTAKTHHSPACALQATAIAPQQAGVALSRAGTTVASAQVGIFVVIGPQERAA